MRSEYQWPVSLNFRFQAKQDFQSFVTCWREHQLRFGYSSILLRIQRTPHIVKIYCLAFEVKKQSLPGVSIAMRKPYNIPLHCSHSSKLKIRLLCMLLDTLWEITIQSENGNIIQSEKWQPVLILGRGTSEH